MIKDNERDYVHYNTMDRRKKYNFKKACKEQAGKKEICKLEKWSFRVRHENNSIIFQMLIEKILPEVVNTG